MKEKCHHHYLYGYFTYFSKLKNQLIQYQVIYGKKILINKKKRSGEGKSILNLGRQGELITSCSVIG